MPIILFIALLFMPFQARGASLPTVIITEIKTEGAASTDEFVELYNFGPEPVPLKSWRLSKKTASGTETNLLTEFPEIVLNASSFLVISHQEYPGPTDLKFSTKQSLADNNTLTLYSDAGQTIVNQIGWGTASVFQGAPAANPDKAWSLQRRYDGATFQNISNNSSDFILAPATVKNYPALAGTASNAPGLPTASPVINEAQPSVIMAPLPVISVPNFLEPLQIQPRKPRVVINEIFPNPMGSDQAEFIELKNLDNIMIDFTYWKVRNKQGSFIFEPENFSAPYLFPEEKFLLKREKSNLPLDNHDDTVRLYDAEGDKIDEIKYEDALEGASLIRPSEPASGSVSRTPRWRWTAMVTEGQENVYIRPQSAPVAHIEIQPGWAGEPSVFDASDSFDKDGDKLAYRWQVAKGAAAFGSDQEIASLTLKDAGKYSVRLRVTDTGGKFSLAGKSVTIKKNPEFFEDEPGDASAKVVASGVKEKTKASKKSRLKKVASVKKSAQGDFSPAPIKAGADWTHPAKANSKWWYLPAIYLGLLGFLGAGWMMQKRLDRKTPPHGY